jgi:hypothetical protein
VIDDTHVKNCVDGDAGVVDDGGDGEVEVCHPKINISACSSVNTKSSLCSLICIPGPPWGRGDGDEGDRVGGQPAVPSAAGEGGNGSVSVLVVEVMYFPVLVGNLSSSAAWPSTDHLTICKTS